MLGWIESLIGPWKNVSLNACSTPCKQCKQCNLPLSAMASSSAMEVDALDVTQQIEAHKAK